MEGQRVPCSRPKTGGMVHADSGEEEPGLAPAQKTAVETSGDTTGDSGSSCALSTEQAHTLGRRRPERTCRGATPHARLLGRVRPESRGPAVCPSVAVSLSLPALLPTNVLLGLSFQFPVTDHRWELASWPGGDTLVSYAVAQSWRIREGLASGRVNDALTTLFDSSFSWIRFSVTGVLSWVSHHLWTTVTSGFCWFVSTSFPPGYKDSPRLAVRTWTQEQRRPPFHAAPPPVSKMLAEMHPFSVFCNVDVSRTQRRPADTAFLPWPHTPACGATLE